MVPRYNTCTVCARVVGWVSCLLAPTAANAFIFHRLLSLHVQHYQHHEISLLVLPVLAFFLSFALAVCVFFRAWWAGTVRGEIQGFALGCLGVSFLLQLMYV